MTIFKRFFLSGLFVFMCFVLLNPNPFSNNPDIIWDESYFLTSSLSAIENATLPGWDFPASGAYYGGPQTYIDTAALVPILGIVLVTSDFSITEAKLWVAQYTGELLHILRLVSGMAALLILVFFFFFFKKKQIPHSLALSLSLFLLLLVSDVLVIEFLHTAKMWAFYILFLIIPSVFFIAQEYYFSHLDKPFIRKEWYVALLVWSSVLMFFQSWVGVLSVALLMLYALLLRHISVRDIWEHARRYWLLLILFSLTQISFVYQAYRVAHTFASTTRTSEGAIDWFARLTKPLVYTVQGQPLSIVFLISILTLLFFALYNKSFFADSRRRMYISIACVHPVLVYFIFYVCIGLDLLPRYAVVLTMACSFSVALLMTEFGRRATIATLTLSGLLFMIVSVHTLQLYWQPSSETVLLNTIRDKYNTSNNVFITEHSARRMTLPVNAESLLLLDEERSAMSRFAFLLQHQDMVKARGEFKPIAITAYRDEQMTAALERFAKGTNSVWVITRKCDTMCSVKEIQQGTCFQINTNACGIAPQEVNTLPVFLSSTQLGYSYVVRKMY